MELTRRDAMAALAAAGVTAGAGCSAPRSNAGADGLADHHVRTLVAVADTVYPSDLAGIPEFVERYVVGRVEGRPAYARGVREAVATLDDAARQWFDGRLAALSPAERASTLDRAGVDVVDPDPEGIGPARIRYYLVNELLFALYASPTGGRLVGIENPQGHPGGMDSYRRGPDAVGRTSPPGGGSAPGDDRDAGGPDGRG